MPTLPKRQETRRTDPQSNAVPLPPNDHTVEDNLLISPPQAGGRTIPRRTTPSKGSLFFHNNSPSIPTPVRLGKLNLSMERRDPVLSMDLSEQEPSLQAQISALKEMSTSQA